MKQNTATKKIKSRKTSTAIERKHCSIIPVYYGYKLVVGLLTHYLLGHAEI